MNVNTIFKLLPAVVLSVITMENCQNMDKNENTKEEKNARKFCGNTWDLWVIRSIAGGRLKKKKCILKTVTVQGLISFIPENLPATQSVQK